VVHSWRPPREQQARPHGSTGRGRAPYGSHLGPALVLGLPRPALPVALRHDCPGRDPPSFAAKAPCTPMQKRHTEPIYWGKREGHSDRPGRPRHRGR
jgi:hypothetical protein